MRFCPECGGPAELRSIGGRDRPVCTRCTFVHFSRHNVGVGGVVRRHGRVLLVRRAQEPGRGRWTIPGGFVETDEPFDQAVEREVAEETGIEARVVGVLGVRHRVTPDGSDLYVVFRLQPVDRLVEPHADSGEVDAAGFYTYDEMRSLPNLAEFTRQIVRVALAGRQPFAPVDVPGFSGPGWTFYAAQPRGV
ncbi:MAG: NUDIX hydrolase [Chloroflexi bacterium]|nr:NUDIX hydrolase [Chloroflexota bacterium]